MTHRKQASVSSGPSSEVAYSTKVQPAIGSWYFEQLRPRLEASIQEKARTIDRLGTPIVSINMNLEGGLPRNSVGMLLSSKPLSTGLYLLPFVKHALIQELKVLLICLEEPQRSVEDHMDRLIFKKSIDEISTEIPSHKLELYEKHFNQSLVILERLGGTSTIPDLMGIQAWMKTWMHWTPDVVVIDNIDAAKGIPGIPAKDTLNIKVKQFADWIKDLNGWGWLGSRTSPASAKRLIGSHDVTYAGSIRINEIESSCGLGRIAFVGSRTKGAHEPIYIRANLDVGVFEELDSSSYYQQYTAAASQEPRFRYSSYRR